MLEHKRIVIFLPKRLGDSIFYTPALTALKKQVPSCTIDIVTLTEVAREVFLHNPAIAHSYRAEDISDYVAFAQSYDYVLELHQHSYVQACIEKMNIKKLSSDVDCTNLATADGYLQRLAELAHISFDDSDRHYHLFPTKADENFAQALLQKYKVGADEKCIVMHLGCHGAAKSAWKFWKKQPHKKVWPLHYFIELAQDIQKKYPHVRFVLTGSALEASFAHRFLKKIKSAIDLTGQTTVLQTAAFMRHVKLVVTSDTGLLHVACAMDTPLIGMYWFFNGPCTRPYPPAPFRRFFVNENVCHILPKDVMACVHDLLKES